MLCHKVDRSDPAGRHGLRPFGYFVVNVRCSHHRLLAAAVIIFVQSPLNPTLAMSQLLLYPGAHSKTLRVAWKVDWCLSPFIPQIHGEFSSLFMRSTILSSQGSLG